MSDLLTIGELAQRTGVATSALRYYEELGLMSAACRVSGQRRYAESTVESVGTLLLLRDVGFSLTEMKALLSTRRQSSSAWRDLARRKIVQLDEQIARARAARVALQHALRCKHEDIVECPNFARVLSGHRAGKSLAEAHSH